MHWIPIVYVSNGSIAPAKFYHVWINMKIEDDCILRFLMMEFCEMYEFYNSNPLLHIIQHCESKRQCLHPILSSNIMCTYINLGKYLVVCEKVTHYIIV